MKLERTRSVTSFNADWFFHRSFDAALSAAMHAGERVHLPHNAVDLPYNYFDETAYQRPFAYQKVLPWRADFADRETSLVFDGAMANAVVFVNGERAGGHRDGYTPFEIRLTPHLRDGDNLITVVIDGSEDPEIPPFGGRIDYLTYAGLYRDVWLKATPQVSIAGLKIETPEPLAARKRVVMRLEIADPQGLTVRGEVTARLVDASGEAIAATSIEARGSCVSMAFEDLRDIGLWDVDRPALYEVVVELATEHGRDRVRARFGFREAFFAPEGFFLNGRHLKIRGLNRHQSFPYVGYALGKRAQERDAEIVKHVLKCNLVRTAHYPQSPWFLDHCDRIGLLVFEEIPGWQHIGGPEWQAEAVENVRRMIRRDWNHPSIVLWGVRINESPDAHAFYSKTNAAARALDPTRQTGGVRCIAESELLEDVYTMNDFVLGSEELPGANRPRIALREQREVTGLARNVPYLVTEFGGHMFPTKRFDAEQRQAEHVTRTLQILDAAYGDKDIAGAIGWCFADYNTHKDFGSGDRICHHGVTDMFREPKFAAHVYRSQCDPADEVVLEPVTFWARGERNIGGILPLIVLTNCEEVELRYGSRVVKRLAPDRAAYPHLPRPPVVFDHRHFSRDELGLWGKTWEDGEIVGFVAGREVAARRYAAAPVPSRLEVAADDLALLAHPKDSTRVIVRARDQMGNLLPYLDESVSIRVSGPARLLGPERATLKGGTIGFWIETTGAPGAIEIKVETLRFPSARLLLEAEPSDGSRESPLP